MVASDTLQSNIKCTNICVQHANLQAPNIWAKAVIRFPTNHFRCGIGVRATRSLQIDVFGFRNSTGKTEIWKSKSISSKWWHMSIPSSGLSICGEGTENDVQSHWKISTIKCRKSNYYWWIVFATQCVCMISNLSGNISSFLFYTVTLDFNWINLGNSCPCTKISNKKV